MVLKLSLQRLRRRRRVVVISSIVRVLGEESVVEEVSIIRGEISELYKKIDVS